MSTDGPSTRKIVWKVTAGIAAAAGAAMARNAATKGWTIATGSEPPRNPVASETTWGRALGWAAVVGLTAGVARMVTRRGAAEAWRIADGSYPQELQPAS